MTCLYHYESIVREGPDAGTRPWHADSPGHAVSQHTETFGVAPDSVIYHGECWGQGGLWGCST